MKECGKRTKTKQPNQPKKNQLQKKQVLKLQSCSQYFQAQWQKGRILFSVFKFTVHQIKMLQGLFHNFDVPFRNLSLKILKAFLPSSVKSCKKAAKRFLWFSVLVLIPHILRLGPRLRCLSHHTIKKPFLMDKL